MNSSSLSMVEAKLPAGFRFHPKDEELICDYLMNKVAAIYHQSHYPLLIEVDLNKSEPWEIPEVACVGGKEWYFYCQRDRKYATGLRTNRATVSGYWKATGKDRSIIRKGNLVGMRKTLVFYEGRAPKGRKSDWVMHEFRLEGPLSTRPQISSLKEDWVLCRVFNKNKDGKQGTGRSSSSNDNDTISCSSLPQLMDPSSYNITFDPNNNINMNEFYYEQVPCFSIFTPTSQTQHFPNGAFPVDTGNYLNSTATCDNNRVIKAVLTHLTTTPCQNIVNSPSFGEGSSETSFLSEVALPTMWNHY